MEGKKERHTKWTIKKERDRQRPKQIMLDTNRVNRTLLDSSIDICRDRGKDTLREKLREKETKAD